MAEVGPWLGGKPPGGVSPYSLKGRQVVGTSRSGGSLLTTCLGTCLAGRNFPSRCANGGDSAKAAAEAYQRKIADDHGPEIKNQYRYREDPRDGLPYIEFHIRGRAGEERYSMCDVGDLPLLEDHIWHVKKIGRNNIYVATTATIDGKSTIKLFHRFKCPDWPIVDHFSEIPEENRNGLDNRSKHLRDGSGGVNEANRRLDKRNTSGVSGVIYNVNNKAWYVQVKHNGVRCPHKSFHGPEDKTHSSYHEACAYAREQAAKVGNTNGQ